MQPFLRWYFPSSQKEKKKEKLMVFKCERGKSCAEKKKKYKKRRRRNMFESQVRTTYRSSPRCVERDNLHVTP
jgi:hypothetical protein